MNAHLLPLAALDVFLIKAVVVIIVFILAGIAQLIAKLQQMQPPAGRPPRPVPPNVAEEIGEFMRRAASRRNAAGGQAAPGSPPKPSPVAPPARVEAAPEPPVGGQVEEHVKKYLDAQEFTRRSEDLGEEVAQADREIDQHMHQVFDHRVSQLELVPGEAAAPPAATFETSETTEAAPVASLPVAVGLLDLIGSPESLRQAIILNEILQRPEYRWG
jgi:hypothetical protein